MGLTDSRGSRNPAGWTGGDKLIETVEGVKPAEPLESTGSTGSELIYSFLSQVFLVLAA